MITLFWSPLDMMQPSYYPHLYGALKQAVRKEAGIRLIDINQHTVDEIRALAGESELIVIDHTIRILHNFWEGTAASRLYYHVHQQKTQAFYAAVWEDLWDAPARKVFVLVCDVHGVDKGPPERLDGLGEHFISEKLSKADAIAWIYRAEELPHVVLPEFEESWMVNYKAPALIAQQVRNAVPTAIELPMCIHPSEFRRTPNRKSWDIGILGANYPTRVLALKTLEEHGGYTLAPYAKKVRWVNAVTHYLIASKVVPDNWISAVKQRLAHRLQERMLHACDYNFTCGSAYFYFVRKFFEIPAANSILLGYLPAYARELGFIDGVNCLYTHPAELARKMDALNAQPTEKEQIRKNGQELIASLHTSERRAEQFIYALKEMLRRPYREAKFVKGVYTIKS